MTLTSSNSGWHKGWFYLQNDPEFALPSYTWCSIAKSQRNWLDARRGAGEDAQASLDRAGAPPKRRSHPGRSDRAIPRPRCRAAPEAAASPLRHDNWQGPLGGDCDCTVAPVAARSSAPRGAGDREVVLLVAAVATAPNAPQRGDRKICKLFVFSACFIRPSLRC
jgi:hypothetical protein